MKARQIILGLGLPVLLAIVLPLLALNLIHKTSPENARQEFAAQYKKATSETERMQLAIGAINNGLIYKDMPIEDADRLFGTDLRLRTPAKGQPPRPGLVFFTPFLPKYDARGWAVQTAPRGWCLVFLFNEFGHVENYMLTKPHKGG